MKKLISLLLLSLVTLYACDDQDYEVQIWTIASEKGVTGRLLSCLPAPAYLIKRGPGQSWEYQEGPEGFTFEPGYECEIRVRIEPNPNPPMDGSSISYTMTELISKQKRQSVDREDFGMTMELVIASERGLYLGKPCYWFRLPDYPTWCGEPLLHEITGFDFEPGYEYSIRVKAVATEDGTDVVYTLVDLISKTQKDSVDLPEEQS